MFIDRFFFKIFVCFFCCLSMGVQAQQKSIGVLSYNVLHGFNGDSNLEKTYTEWVKTVGADIVLYQELNGFDQQHLRGLASAYGHSHSVLLNQESGFDVTHPIGITATLPIQDVEMYVDTMWHGYIYAKIGNVHCFVTHLAPFTLRDRRADLARIIAHAATIPSGENILIAGDFNALSAADSAMYGPKLLASMQQIEGRLEPKSGTPIVKNRIIYRNNLNNGHVDYSVIGLIKDAGFLDAYYLRNSAFKNSVPTKSHVAKDAIQRRIDYIWVNPTLAEKVYQADVIQNDQTAGISDHYPVMIRFTID